MLEQNKGSINWDNIKEYLKYFFHVVDNYYMADSNH